MIGSFFHSAFLRISRVAVEAVHLGHHHVHQHEVDATALPARELFERLQGLPAVAGDLDDGAARLEDAGQGEDVAHVVLDHEDAPALERGVAAARLREHLLLLGAAAPRRPGAGTASPRRAAARATSRP